MIVNGGFMRLFCMHLPMWVSAFDQQGQGDCCSCVKGWGPFRNVQSAQMYSLDQIRYGCLSCRIKSNVSSIFNTFLLHCEPLTTCCLCVPFRWLSWRWWAWSLWLLTGLCTALWRWREGRNCRQTRPRPPSQRKTLLSLCLSLWLSLCLCLSFSLSFSPQPGFAQHSLTNMFSWYLNVVTFSSHFDFWVSCSSCERRLTV